MLLPHQVQRKSSSPRQTPSSASPWGGGDHFESAHFSGLLSLALSPPGSPVFPAPCVEKTVVFPTELSWHLGQQSIDHKCKLFWMPLLFHWSVGRSVPVPHCLVVSSEIGKCEPFDCVLLVQDCFDYSGSTWIKISLPISPKIQLVFSYNHDEPVGQLAILTIW